jgi:hypothetical protein
MKVRRVNKTNKNKCSGTYGVDLVERRCNMIAGHVVSIDDSICNTDNSMTPIEGKGKKRSSVLKKIMTKQWMRS